MKDSTTIDYIDEWVDADEKHWDKTLQETYDFHDLNPNHWTSVNGDIVEALHENNTIPPVTFASHVTLDYIDSELDYEIERMKQRFNTEISRPAQYFRATYAKYCVWMMSCKAVTSQNLVSVRTISEGFKLAESGVRSIFDEATDAGFTHQVRIGNRYMYCATNSTMQAFVDRSIREVNFFSEDKMRNIHAFKSFLKYLPRGERIVSNDWFERKF